NTASSISVGTVTPITSCAANATGGGNAGAGANEGSQTWGCGGNVTATFKVGNQPVGSNQTSGNATKGVALVIPLSNSDADGNTMTCAVVSSPTKGGVTLNGTGNCTANYTASANTSGNDSFTYNITDSDGLVSPSTYTVTVPIVNRAPTGAAQSGLTFNKGAASPPITLAATDLDNDTVTCAVTTPTTGTISGSVPGTSCSRTITPAANTVGAGSFTYTVIDSIGATSASYTVSFTVANRTPVSANQTLTVDAGSPIAATLGATDIDGDTLTCSPSTPSKGALTGTNCNKTYTSNAGTANAGVGGADSFTYTVSDQNGATSPTSTVSITVNNPDLSLVKSHTGRFQPGTGTGTYTLAIANTSSSVVNGTTTLVDTLPAGMAYRSYAAGTSGFTCTATAGVSTTVNCSRASQIPKPFSGSLTITVDVTENAGSPVTNSAVISSVYELASTAANNTATDSTLVNHRPTATGQSVATDINVPTPITLIASDPDSDPLTFSILSGPANGSLSGSGASRQYSPDTDFQGVDQFTYKVTDNDGLQSSVVTVKVYVGVSQFTGTVTSDVGGGVLSGVEVRLVDNSNPADPDPVTVATAVTNGSGNYDFASQFPSLGAVPFGDYVVRFVDPANNYLPEWNVEAASRATATNVNVSSASPLVSISAALTPAGRIQGTIRSSAGANPTVGDLQVRLIKIGTPGSRSVTTGPDGQYKFELIVAGDYQLWFRDVSGDQWVSEWYDDQPDQDSSATVSMTVGQQRLIDEQVDPVVVPPPPTRGTIAGTVRASTVGNAPISGIQVRLYVEPYTTSAAATTDVNGQYTFPNKLAGNYKIWFRVVTGKAFVSEYYDDAESLASADVIALGANTYIADAQLSPPATAPARTSVISGTITQLDGVTPIAAVQVRLYVNGVLAGSTATTTDGDGFYTFTGKAAGLYQLYFRDMSGSYFSEWYNNQPNQGAADPVTASDNTTTTVDARLSSR
ncbi:MAG: putative Ig protein, partial [Acidimicrobiales bacterium]|nr:putative Ig protein [Acidimicrobiales bacterium]